MPPDDISFATALTARAVPSGASVRAGYGVCHDTSGVYFVEASTANLAAVGEVQAEAIALESASGNGVPFRVAVSGYIPPSIANIGIGTAGDFVETDANGALTRNSSQSTTTIGKANKFGGVKIQAQGLSSSNATLIQSVFVTAPTVRGTELGYSGSSLTWEWPDRLNVLRFGADRTGVADSAPAINLAISALGQGSGGIFGGTIVFPPGKYLVASKVNVGDFSVPGGGVTGIHLEGAGGGSSYGNSISTLVIDVNDTRATGCTLTVSGGFVTATKSAGTFAATDFDCTIRVWGDRTNEANNGTFTVTSVAGDGSSVTYYNTGGVAASGLSVCVGHVGLNIRTGDVWLDKLRILSKAGNKLTALVDWTESGQAIHSALTRLYVTDCYLSAADPTSPLRYDIRIGRDVATDAVTPPFHPANMDYFKCERTQLWYADEANVGIPQQSGQSRSNSFINCDLIGAPNAVWCSGGTQLHTVGGTMGGNFGAPKFSECLFALGGSLEPISIIDIGSEGASNLFRIGSASVHVFGGQMTLSAANMRKDQVIAQVGNSISSTSFDGFTVITSDVSAISVYAVASTSGFETSVNFNNCSMPVSSKAFEPHYLPSTKKGPWIFHDGDVLSFTVDGVAKSVTLHTTGSAGVPIGLNGSRAWKFGVSGSIIPEAQAWEIAQLIEEQIPGLGALAYGDQSQIQIWSTSSVSGSVIATYPLGASDPNQAFGWTAGLFINSALTQCSIDTQGFVGPGPNNSSYSTGNVLYDPATKARRPGGSWMVRTGSATNGAGFVLSGLTSMGSGLVARKNFRGTATILSGNASVTVTLPVAELDANYVIEPICTAAVPVLASVRSKGTTSFQLVAPAAVGADTTYDWVMFG